MTRFEHIVKKEDGLRPEDIERLIHHLRDYSSEIWFIKDGQKANARLIFNLLTLNIRLTDIITIEVFGENDHLEAETLKTYLQENL